MIPHVGRGFQTPPRGRCESEAGYGNPALQFEGSPNQRKSAFPKISLPSSPREFRGEIKEIGEQRDLVVIHTPEIPLVGRGRRDGADGDIAAVHRIETP